MPVSDRSSANKWRFKFPNTADFNFNYWTLLNDDDDSPIAIAPSHKNCRIAIVGAGVAGLTAARELFRSGYTNIDIYEATGRLGGRTYSVPSPLPDGVTTYELGAMRLSFFWPYDRDLKSTGKRHHYGPGSKNCVLDYYCTRFGITTQPFPNPGDVSTGIYINRGRGPIPQYYENVHKLPPPTLINWATLGDAPGEPTLDKICHKWATFKTTLQQECSRAYGRDSEWSTLWKEKLRRYANLSFREFVRLAAADGGLGMDPDEARVFAVIGMGDGGWGAFYDISCLWVLRTLVFGLADKLQLIRGVVNTNGIPLRWSEEDPSDSLGQHLDPPKFLGVQSLAECLFYGRDRKEKSLYKAVTRARQRQAGVHLYMNNPIRSLTFLEEESTGLPPFRKTPDRPPVRVVSDRLARAYDAVIITAPPWSLVVETPFQNFSPARLPWKVREAMNSSHFIASCKVFYPLKARYWEHSSIPQVIITDTFVQGAYGLAVVAEHSDYPGVLLASYTWEDDATKLVSDDDQELGRRCLEHLDSLLGRCGFEDRLSDYVDNRAAFVHHWVRSQWQRGCARLYRPGNAELDAALLTFNPDYSAKSHLYLAGESYSVEGGWVEPALRSALDATIHLVRNTGGTFRKGFDYERHYPKY